MTVWFTSDLHLGHARLLELSEARGAAFASIDEHDARLVANWNEAVAPDDTVWVLGDVDMHGKDTSLGRISALAGTKILVAGITTPAGRECETAGASVTVIWLRGSPR